MNLTYFSRTAVTYLFFVMLTSSSLIATDKEVLYLIEQSKDDPSVLKIQLGCDLAEAGQFSLRGKALNVQSQVDRLTCDGKEVKEKDGLWLIPAGVHHLAWQVQLKNAEETEIGVQQSIISNKSILLSEVLSLPRFKNPPGREVLKVLIEGAKLIPEPNGHGDIAFPKTSEPPFFVLVNHTQLSTVKTDSISLTYLIDHMESKSFVPDMNDHLKGLEWLKNKAGVKEYEHFTVSWNGIKAEQHCVAGATGAHILLVNYLYNKDSKSDKAMLLSVALHEAFHQLQEHYPAEPVWVKESLANYYGVQAVKVVLPREEYNALMDRFQKHAKDFKHGLLKTDSEVKGGDDTNYGAFYTKGLSFWTQVNKALEEQHDSLDNHLIEILKVKYDPDNQDAYLNKLAQIFKLPNPTWSSLYKGFLQDTPESL